MTGKEFISNLREINNFHKEAIEIVSQTALSLVKSRIQIQGLEGESYSDSYSKSKRFKRLGRSKSRVDLTDTGRMMKEIKIAEIEIKGNKITVKAGVTSEDIKFKYTMKQYGNYLEPNAEEKEIIEGSLEQIYKRKINELFA